jgi:hypothetical protein
VALYPPRSSALLDSPIRWSGRRVSEDGPNKLQIPSSRRAAVGHQHQASTACADLSSTIVLYLVQVLSLMAALLYFNPLVGAVVLFQAFPTLVLFRWHRTTWQLPRGKDGDGGGKGEQQRALNVALSEQVTQHQSSILHHHSPFVPVDASGENPRRSHLPRKGLYDQSMRWNHRRFPTHHSQSGWKSCQALRGWRYS